MAGRSVLIDGVQSLDVTGPLEVFAGAGAAVGHAAYEITTASVGGAPVRTGSGLTIGPDLDLRDAGTPHTVIVPGGPGTRTPAPELVSWLRHTAAGAERIVSVCTGAFLLAEAGLLRGRRATTHWANCARLAERTGWSRSPAAAATTRRRPCGRSAGRDRHGADPGRAAGRRRGGPGHPAHAGVRPAAAVCGWLNANRAGGHHRPAAGGEPVPPAGQCRRPARPGSIGPRG